MHRIGEDAAEDELTKRRPYTVWLCSHAMIMAGAVHYTGRCGVIEVVATAQRGYVTGTPEQDPTAPRSGQRNPQCCQSTGTVLQDSEVNATGTQRRCMCLNLQKWRVSCLSPAPSLTHKMSSHRYTTKYKEG